MSRPTSPQASASASSWIARCGTAAFLFFLIKGLAWIVVPALIALAMP